MKKIISNKCVQAFFLSFILGGLIVGPTFLLNRGIFNLNSDFDLQQIPFLKMMNYSIKEGSIMWTWYNELGSSFISAFSFYNLLSPFSLLSYFIKSDLIKYFIGPLVVLKYGVSGLTSYLYLKRYVKNKNYALLGSLLYSFSGFQLTTLLFHFHDVIALFPLLLYTFDNLIYDDKKNRFVYVLAMMTLTNWFFAIGECVFLFIYWIIKMISKEIEVNRYKIKNVVVEVLLGLLISSIILVPTLLFVKSNPRVGNQWSLIYMLKYSPSMYSEIIRAFIFPNEVMFPHAFLTDFNYASVEMYLPVVGIVLSSVYVLNNKKNWLSIMICLLLVFAFVPILNSSFIAFQTSYYTRWFFMYSILLSLASIKSLEEKYDRKKGFFITVIALILYLIIVTIIGSKLDKSIFYLKEFVILACCVMVINLLITTFIKNNKILFVAVCLYVVVWGNVNVYYYKYKSFQTSYNYKEYLRSNIIDNKDVRYSMSNNCHPNLGMVNMSNNITTFNSNISGSSFEFFNSIGVYNTVSSRVKTENKDLLDFLSVKYVVACNGDKLDNFKYIKSEDSFDLYENENYKSIGIEAIDYISNNKFYKLSNEEKIKTLQSTVVLNKKQIDKYKNIFNKEEKVTNVKFDFVKNGFKSKVKSNEASFIVYTVPYDEGFTAYNNGKKIKYEKVDNGFIGVKINKGINKIEFKYVPKGLKEGIIVSLVSLIVAVAITIKCKLKSKKNL